MCLSGFLMFISNPAEVWRDCKVPCGWVSCLYRAVRAFAQAKIRETLHIEPLTVFCVLSSVYMLERELHRMLNT